MALQEIEPKIREIISNTTVCDEDDIPFSSYQEFLEQVQEGRVQIGCRYDGDLVTMFGTKGERFGHLLLVFSPFLIAIACVATAFMLSNYWLLFGPLLAGAGFVFSSPIFMRAFGGGLILVAAILLLGYALYVGHSTTAILAGTYALSNLLTIAAREQCRAIVHRSTLLSEPVFIWLLGNNKIRVTQE